MDAPSGWGLVTGILASVVLGVFNSEGITGGGYATLSEALSGNIAFRARLVLCVIKLAATVFSYGFIGFVTEARLRRTAADGGLAQRVDAIVQSSPHVQADDTLVRAVVKMEKSGSRQLAVVEPRDGNKLIGLLTMSDIVRAHARAAIDAEDYDRPELSALSRSRQFLKE